MNVDIEKIKFPIGRYMKPEAFNVAVMNDAICTLEELPQKLRTATQDLSEEQLNTPYREGGWTIRQVVHHIADSHINGYIRMKLAVTESIPTIKSYDQDKWATLYDSMHAPISISLDLIEALHQRWVHFLRSLEGRDFRKKFHHPESNQNQSLGLWLTIYAWHSDHHLSHITQLRERLHW